MVNKLRGAAWETLMWHNSFSSSASCYQLFRRWFWIVECFFFDVAFFWGEGGKTVTYFDHYQIGNRIGNHWSQALKPINRSVSIGCRFYLIVTTLVCMYVCMYACMYVCIYVCIHVPSLKESGPIMSTLWLWTSKIKNKMATSWPYWIIL